MARLETWMSECSCETILLLLLLYIWNRVSIKKDTQPFSYMSFMNK